MQSIPDRSFKRTAQYAAAVVSAGRELSVPVLNLFQELQDLAPNNGWSDRFMLPDGLHFNDEGQALVAK